jgi:hypothetical protein
MTFAPTHGTMTFDSTCFGAHPLRRAILMILHPLRTTLLQGLIVLMGAVGCSQAPPVEIDSQLLNGVNDYWFDTGSDEYHLLVDHARKVRVDDLETAGRTIPHAGLMARPREFRGQPITISGVLWRLFELPNRDLGTEKPENQNSLYEAWIFTSPTEPYRVVCSHLPMGLEPGQKLKSVRATGFFLMLESHDDEWSTRIAPLLIAPQLLATNEPVDPDFRIQFDERDLNLIQPVKEVNLPDIQVRLRSKTDGTLHQLLLGGQNLGNGDAAFQRLNKEILKIIGRPGNPLVRDIHVVIDPDFETEYSSVVNAVAACAGRIDRTTGTFVRYIEIIRFAPPVNPRSPDDLNL